VQRTVVLTPWLSSVYIYFSATHLYTSCTSNCYKYFGALHLKIRLTQSYYFHYLFQKHKTERFFIFFKNVKNEVFAPNKLPNMHNLEDLFRDADDKLLEMPSSRAWNKLENRLEARVSDRDRERARLKGQFTRQMSVAAAVLATVLIAGVWATMHLLPMNTDRMAQGKVTHFSPTMEANKSEDAAIITETTPLQPIENTTDNRLVEQKAKDTRTITLANTTVASVTPSSVHTQKPSENKIIVAEIAPQTATTTVAPPPAKAEATVNYIDGNKDGIDDRYAEQTKKASAAPKAESKKPTIAAAPKTTPIRATESAMNSAPPRGELVKQVMLTDLDWLVGAWQNRDKTAGTVDNWRKEGRFTLYGDSFRVQNGDSTLTQTIKIQQEGNLLALYTTIDATQKMYRYELHDREPTAWTFVNEALSYPQKIVLKRNDRNAFDLIMQGNTNKNVKSFYK
jgi:hypothetical protein